MIKYLLTFLSFFPSCFAPKRTILIVNFDGVKDSIVSGVAERVKKQYNANVYIVGDTMPSYVFITPFYFLYGESAGNAKKVIDYLAFVYKGTDKVLGITNEPMMAFRGFSFSPVFGYGKWAGRASIISTDDLDTLRLISQLSTLSIHELGHTFGLDHCPKGYARCYMYSGDGTIQSLNMRKFFCQYCQQAMRKITDSTKFRK